MKWFFLAVLVLVVFFYSNLIKSFSGLFQSVITPIWVAENKISENTANPLGFLSSKKDLIIKNEQLQEDIITAEMMLADRNLLLKENLELKEIMGRSDSSDFILASVLNKPNVSEYDSLIIDAGNSLGVKIGDKVTVLGDVIIGEIVEVGTKTSKVKLYSSSGEETETMVGLFNISATAVGKGGGNFEIKIPRGVEVEIGDPISSYGLNAPVFGSVEEIISSPADSFKILLFKSPINIFELKWVQILKSE
ncbi:hypothetical protein KKC45_03060 [Patescibacteria group bacterium]|nr:hypothetical protein [Patescibacteria group bacterium]